MNIDKSFLRIDRPIVASLSRIMNGIKSGALFASCGNDVVEIESKVGGKYLLKSVVDGSEISGEFLEIEGNKIVFTWSECGRVAITLVSIGDGTILKLAHDEIPDERLYDQFLRAWINGLDAFQEKMEEL